MSVVLAGVPTEDQAGPKPAPSESVKPRARQEREARKGLRGALLWFKDLPAARKTTSTAATERVPFERVLFEVGARDLRLDGDLVRRELSADLDPSPVGRRKSIRRNSESAGIGLASGLIGLVAVVAPLGRYCELARRVLPPSSFLEFYVPASLACRERRDPQGLHARAQRGERIGMTEVDAPDDEPLRAELVPRRDLCVHSIVAKLMGLLCDHDVIASPTRQRARLCLETQP